MEKWAVFLIEMNKLLQHSFDLEFYLLSNNQFCRHSFSTVSIQYCLRLRLLSTSHSWLWAFVQSFRRLCSGVGLYSGLKAFSRQEFIQQAKYSFSTSVTFSQYNRHKSNQYFRRLFSTVNVHSALQFTQHCILNPVFSNSMLYVFRKYCFSAVVCSVL